MKVNKDSKKVTSTAAPKKPATQSRINAPKDKSWYDKQAKKLDANKPKASSTPADKANVSSEARKESPTPQSTKREENLSNNLMKAFELVPDGNHQPELKKNDQYKLNSNEDGSKTLQYLDNGNTRNIRLDGGDNKYAFHRGKDGSFHIRTEGKDGAVTSTSLKSQGLKSKDGSHRPLVANSSSSNGKQLKSTFHTDGTKLETRLQAGGESNQNSTEEFLNGKLNDIERSGGGFTPRSRQADKSKDNVSDSQFIHSRSQKLLKNFKNVDGGASKNEESLAKLLSAEKLGEVRGDKHDSTNTRQIDRFNKEFRHDSEQYRNLADSSEQQIKKLNQELRESGDPLGYLNIDSDKELKSYSKDVTSRVQSGSSPDSARRGVAFERIAFPLKPGASAMQPSERAKRKEELKAFVEANPQVRENHEYAKVIKDVLG